MRARTLGPLCSTKCVAQGCAVIRMLQGWLGAEPFRRGLVQYLDAFKYRNAVTSDLWNALGAASGNPNVARVMDSWIKQTGYPVLLVEETTAPQGATGQRTLKLSQRRFLQGGGSAQEGPQVSGMRLARTSLCCALGWRLNTLA